MKTIRSIDLGSLQALFVENDKSFPTICLLHGYGADHYDLTGLMNEHPCKEKFNWVFPRAPNRLSEGGFGWFKISIQELNLVMNEQIPILWSKKIPEGILESRALLDQFFHQLGIDNSQLILGGFSQGAIMSTDYALRSSASVLGLMLFSGTLCMEDQWREFYKTSHLPSFIQTHGIYDYILGVEQARNLHSLLDPGKSSSRYLEFSGGHEINLEVMSVYLDYTTSFLKR